MEKRTSWRFKPNKEHPADGRQPFRSLCRSNVSGGSLPPAGCWSFGRGTNRLRNLQREVAAEWLNHLDENNTMSSGQPEDADNTKREQRQRRIRIFVGLMMVFVFGVPPLLNALNNPRIQALHGADVLGLIASGLVIGFGLGLLLSPLFRGEYPWSA